MWFWFLKSGTYPNVLQLLHLNQFYMYVYAVCNQNWIEPTTVRYLLIYPSLFCFCYIICAKSQQKVLFTSIFENFEILHIQESKKWGKDWVDLLLFYLYFMSYFVQYLKISLVDIKYIFGDF